MATPLERLGNECLRVQISLASAVACKLQHRVYVFCPSSFFSTPPFDVVLYDNVRTTLKNGKTALLSSAAQAVLTSNAEYRSLVPQTKISEDSTGVYINP